MRSSVRVPSRNWLCADLWLWMIGSSLAAGFVIWHARAVERYLDRVTLTRFTDEPVETPLRRIPQAIAPDGQMWIRHALELAESGAWRLRSTDVDNAPHGRSVYWNSAWALWLSGCGRVRMAFTGEPLATAIESASLWANLPVFLCVLALASGWVWRRWGGVAGAFTAVAMAGHRKFYEGFYPGYCDHHGLISASIFGVVLGALLAGAGWWARTPRAGFSPLPKSEAEVMQAVTLSAVCGALGMWVSAASLVLTIALTGLAALLACVLKGRTADDELICAPAAWRRWGRVGATLTIGFYLLENFPDRLGMRLEVNHPIYSLAWWGAGEGIAAMLVWWTEKRPVTWLVPRVGVWGVMVLAAPVAIFAEGAKVFAPLDPFLARIHASIHEFEPLRTAILRVGWRPYGDQLFISVLIFLLFLWWARSKPPVQERLLVGFIGCLAVGATGLGWFQNRWLLTASGPQIGLSLVLMMGVVCRLRCGIRAPAILMLTALMFVPGPWTLASERLLVERVRDVQLGETVQLLYRDIAGALLRSGADPRSVVLASPNTSVGVGYYGRLRTVGTLYWENTDGLRTSAEIFGTRDDAEAAARIHTQGITHVVMISTHDFLAEYDYALRGKAGGADNEGFGRRLLYQHRVPVWLRPLDYSVPSPLAGLGFKVALFAVDFEAPLSVAHERIGLYQLAKGERDLAADSLLAAVIADPSRAETWLLQGQLMLSAGRLSEAFNSIKAGIERAPAGARASLIKAAASAFSQQGAEGRRLARALLKMLEQDGRVAE